MLHFPLINCGENMTFDEINNMVSDMDEDGDGEVDCDELLQLMTAKKAERSTGRCRHS